jgi:hypothetical protein
MAAMLFLDGGELAEQPIAPGVESPPALLLRGGGFSTSYASPHAGPKDDDGDKSGETTLPDDF